MADPDFVMAVDPHGNKRLVPPHYLDNPAFGFKLPPSSQAKEPVQVIGTTVREPAQADDTATVEEPAAATPNTIKRSGAAGENKEAN